MGMIRRTGLVCLISLLLVASAGNSQEVDHSPGRAFGISLAATAAPIAAGLLHNSDIYRFGLISAGIMIGPAAGYWTGGVAGRGWKGIGFRGLILGATAATVVGICTIDRCDIFEDEQDATVVALVVTLLGGAVIVGSSIIDIVEAPAHVRRANESRLKLSLAPVISPMDGGTFGLAGSLRF